MDGAIGGTAFVKVDGRQADLRGSFIVSPSSVEREGVAGQDGVHGYIEKPRVPFIKGDLSTTDGLSIRQLDAIRNSTIIAELNNGKAYVLRGAWTKGAHEIDTTQGKVSVEWHGKSCEEL